jgi:hypothetical protein
MGLRHLRFPGGGSFSPGAPQGPPFYLLPRHGNPGFRGLLAGGTGVIDGNIITSRAAGTAAAWAVTIIGKLVGEGAAKKIASSVLLA